MGSERLGSVSKKRFRNLRQYKDLSDEEFEEIYNRKYNKELKIQDFEERVDRIVDSLAEDYDFEDLNSNDKMVLRALAQALANLEDIELMTHDVKLAGVTSENLQLFEKLSNISSSLRNDITKLQNDLGISRKTRKNDDTANLVEELDDLKSKAKKFYKERMSYIFCPKCGMLLGTIWTLYPEYKFNRINLHCGRKLEDGTVCGEKVSVTTLELMENRGTNRPEIMPDGLL